MTGHLEDPDPDALREWAAAAVARGREAWPELEVDEEELMRVAALRLSRAEEGRRTPSMADLDVAELYLAAACMRGDRVALVQLRVRYFDRLTVPLRRMGLDPAQCDDVWQALSERLLVRHQGEPPRIVRYAGSGELKGLLRVAATRIALNWLEQENRQASGEHWIEAIPSGDSDPELHAMKRQHRVDFKQELERVLAGLTARERMALRMHLVERVSIDAIAALLSVHRATAARLIARAKDKLSTGVRAALAARWKVPEPSLPILQTLIDSQLDLSLERLLSEG